MVTPADLVRAVPGDVEKQLTAILNESPQTLPEEADRLTRAHAVLQAALQGGQ